MKKRFSAFALLLAVAAFSLTGCGIVTVVKTGEEAALTGETTVDVALEAGTTWDAVVEEITQNAAELSELDIDSGTGAYAVKGTGTITAIDQKSKNGSITLSIDGYTNKTVKISIGPVYSSTSVRDAQTQKAYSDFTNQGEWSEYALGLNKIVDEQVVAPNNFDANSVGKTVTFTGACGAPTGDTIMVTPVALTVE